MQHFLLKRPVPREAASSACSAEPAAKKQLSRSRRKSSGDPLRASSLKTAVVTAQCVKATAPNPTQRSEAAASSKGNISNPFANPFSLAAPSIKSVPATATQQARLMGAKSTASQSILKTVKAKQAVLPATATKSLHDKKASGVAAISNKEAAPAASSSASSSGTSVGQKRKVSSYFTNHQKACAPNIATDISTANTQMKENQDSSLLNASSKNSVSQVRNSVSASLREITSINIDTEKSSAASGNLVDPNPASHTLTSALPENSAADLQNKEQEQEQNEEQKEEQVDAADTDTADTPFIPFLIPNLLEKKTPADLAGAAPPRTNGGGVIRHKLAPFTQSPQSYSHIRHALGLSQCRLMSLLGSRVHAVASPAGPVELLNYPREARYGSAATRRGGVTCVQFDKGGVLCAVGGSNGVLRVYDFDDVTCALQQAANVEIACDPGGEQGLERQAGTAGVHPMVHFSGSGRDIAAITWLPSCSSGAEQEEGEEEEVAVAFTHHPDIHIYDLNTLERVQCLVPSQMQSSGNCCVLRLRLPVTVASPHTPAGGREGVRQSVGRVHVPVNRILAGGADGIVRYWKVPQLGARRGGDNRIKPVWEVLADPMSKAGSHCAVMAILQSPQQPGLLTTVTKQGVIVQWDMDKLSVQSFCASATPMSLRRVVLSESISGVVLSPVVGASFARKGFNYSSKAAITNNTTKLQGSTADSLLCLTLTSGYVLLFDVVERRLLEGIKCPLNSSAAGVGGNPPQAGAVTISNDQGDGNITLEASPTLLCPVSFSSVTGNQLIYCAALKSDHLDIMRMGGSSALLSALPREHLNRRLLATLQQQHLRYANAVSYLEHLLPASIAGSVQERYITQQLATMCLSSPPLMQRCARICHTLQGHVVSATPGTHRIVTSHDLSAFLCATGQENRIGARVEDNSHEDSSHPSVPSTSTTRQQVSISGMLNGNKSSVLHLKIGTGLAETICYTIDTIFGCEICLDKPYHGPLIAAGEPRTSLRTNLQPRPPPSTSSSTNTTSSSPSAHSLISSLRYGGAEVKGPQKESSGICGERLAHIPLPSRATAIQPHPHCPYVVVGCLDDSVVVLSAES